MLSAVAGSAPPRSTRSQSTLVNIKVVDPEADLVSLSSTGSATTSVLSSGGSTSLSIPTLSFDVELNYRNYKSLNAGIQIRQRKVLQGYSVGPELCWRGRLGNAWFAGKDAKCQRSTSSSAGTDIQAVAHPSGFKVTDASFLRIADPRTKFLQYISKSITQSESGFKKCEFL